MFWKSFRHQNHKPLPLLTLISFLVFAGVQLLIAAPAKAECWYEGKKYETGQTRGPYVCMPNGTWQPK